METLRTLQRFRRIGLGFSIVFFLLFTISIVFYFCSLPSFELLIAACSGNYLLTSYIILRLYSSFQKSNLLLNFYLTSSVIFPFIWPIAYFLLWMDKLSLEIIEKYSDRIKKYQDYALENSQFGELREEKRRALCERLSQVTKYNYLVYKSPLTTNNSSRIIIESKDHILCIVNLIKKATKFIHLEYYIFSEGYVFNYLIQLLARKAQEGVEVKLIVDGWGNYYKISRKMLSKMNELGIKVKVFNSLFQRGELWWNFRNHNKFIIVDNEYVLFGSCNISDEYFNITDKFFPTTEFSILLEGEIVNSFNLLFAFHWNLIPSSQREFDILLNRRYYFPAFTRPCGGIELQLVHSSPLSETQPIKTNLLQLIFSAKRSIRILTPYFYPPQDILNALKMVARLGVKVQIILPKEADFNDRVLRVHRTLLCNFCTENIEVYEYFGFNHEKLTIIDREIVYFGTYNWDYRSFYWNFESALIIRNEKMVSKMNYVFSKRLVNSHLITRTELMNYNRIFPSIFIGISRWCKAFA